MDLVSAAVPMVLRTGAARPLATIGCTSSPSFALALVSGGTKGKKGSGHPAPPPREPAVGRAGGHRRLAEPGRPGRGGGGRGRGVARRLSVARRAAVGAAERPRRRRPRRRRAPRVRVAPGVSGTTATTRIIFTDTTSMCMVCTEVGRRGSYVQSWKCVYSTRQKASEFTRWRSTRRELVRA